MDARADAVDEIAKSTSACGHVADGNLHVHIIKKEGEDLGYFFHLFCQQWQKTIDI